MSRGSLRASSRLHRSASARAALLPPRHAADAALHPAPTLTWPAPPPSRPWLRRTQEGCCKGGSQSTPGRVKWRSHDATSDGVPQGAVWASMGGGGPAQHAAPPAAMQQFRAVACMRHKDLCDCLPRMATEPVLQPSQWCGSKCRSLLPLQPSRTTVAHCSHLSCLRPCSCCMLYQFPRLLPQQLRNLTASLCMPVHQHNSQCACVCLSICVQRCRGASVAGLILTPLHSACTCAFCEAAAVKAAYGELPIP